MLYRLIYASQAAGSTGASTLSVAQIVGASITNNRRDNLTSAVMFHDGRCLQGVEGSREDIDRMMRRVRVDRRHHNIRVLSDKAIAERRFTEPMLWCEDPAAMLRAIGAHDMASITAYDADRIIELKQAA